MEEPLSTTSTPTSQTPDPETPGNATQAPGFSIVPIQSREVQGGASYGHFRLCSNEPKKNLTTVADRVAARLVGHLNDEHSSLQVMTATGYIPCLPKRLCNSTALRDCVALACSAWTNFRRNAPIDNVIDLKLHVKALRSIQKAIDGPQSLSAETLAAVSLLERLEIVFDVNRPRHRTRHARGVQSLMVKRGPPDLHDEMDIFLAIENHASMVCVHNVDFLMCDVEIFLLADLLSPPFVLLTVAAISTSIHHGRIH